jgi:hypothetical protein
MVLASKFTRFFFVGHFIFQRPFASLFATLTSGVLTLASIITIDTIYEKVASKINQWGMISCCCCFIFVKLKFLPEMHKTETQYEKNLTFKLFVLFFVNYYVQAFYISFGKGRYKVMAIYFKFYLKLFISMNRMKIYLFGNEFFETVNIILSNFFYVFSITKSFFKCSHTGCHIEIAFYLFINFAAKQMIKSFIEIGYP